MPVTSNYAALASAITDLADAVRAKAGTASAMTLAEMRSAVEGLELAAADAVTSSPNSQAAHGFDWLSAVNRDYVGFVSHPTLDFIPQCFFANAMSLTSVYFPAVKTVANQAFANCQHLESAVFLSLNSNASGTSPQLSAIAGSSYRGLINSFISGGASHAACLNQAFAGCKRLSRVELGGVRTFTSAMFDVYCANLETVVLPHALNISNNATYPFLYMTPNAHSIGIYLPGSSVAGLAISSSTWYTAFGILSSNVSTSTGAASAAASYITFYVPESLVAQYKTKFGSASSRVMAMDADLLASYRAKFGIDEG